MNATGVTLTRQSICVTCLSQERKLFPVNDSKPHASFLVHVSEGDKLCWECHFFVLKVFAFRSRAERAQALLASALHQNNETDINSLSSLKMTPVYLEISLQKSDLLQENVKTETMKEECEDTLYECPIEDNYNSDDVPCDDSLKELNDESLLPLLNEQTEAKGDEGACSYTMDDDTTNTSMKLLNEKDLLIKRQARPCKREPRRGADATPEPRHAGAGGAAARSRALQHHEHTSCFDGLQQVPLADKQLSRGTIPVTSHLRVRTSRKPFGCDICNRRFIEESSLTTHLLLHTGEKQFNCNKCGKQFNLKSALKTHMKIHKGEKPNSCDICNIQFSNRMNKSRHLRLHKGERMFCCDVCGKQMKTKATLTEHLGIHRDERPFGCDKCEKRYKQRRALKTHLLTHLDVKPIKCDVCSKRFINRPHMLNHLKVHTKPCCNICNKRFRTELALVYHRNIHTGEKSFSCDICKKLFITKKSLRHHVRLIHTYKDVKPFCCDICQKRFKLKSDLAIHMRFHTGERRYGCDVCGKRFTGASVLKAHIRIHTGEKPFSCEICGKRFNQKSSMKTHLRTHTGKKGRT